MGEGEQAPSPTKPLGLGCKLILCLLLLLPAVVSYESLDQFFNVDGGHQCNAVFCFRRDTSATHAEVTSRAGQETSRESVYYCADHASLAELDLAPRLWRLVVWLLVALCHLILLVAALALVVNVWERFKGKPQEP